MKKSSFLYLMILTCTIMMPAYAKGHPERANIFTNEHPVFQNHPGRGKGLKKGHKKHRKYRDHGDYRHKAKKYHDKHYDQYQRRYEEELYGMERRRYGQGYYDPRNAIRAPIDAVIDNTVDKMHRSLDGVRDRAIESVDKGSRKILGGGR